MSQIKKGDWVQIHQIVLRPEERPTHLPEDTRKVPLEQWVKGFLNHDGEIGQEVEITTITGRVVTGELVAVNPTYDYGYGEEYVPELLRVGKQIKGILRDGENNE